MARARIIKPDFFRSRSITRLSLGARLTFIGMWTEADAEGRGDAHPAIIKGSVWPLDLEVAVETVEQWLHELHSTGHIVLYNVDDVDYFEIPSWKRHQSAAYRTGESKYPPPSGETCKLLQLAQPVVQPAKTTLHEMKGKEGKGMVTRTRRTTPSDPLPAGFAEFWQAYPRKTAKVEAVKAWNRQQPPLAATLEALARQVRGWTDPKFIPHPSTWINQRRWEDETPAIGDTYRQPVEW